MLVRINPTEPRSACYHWNHPDMKAALDCLFEVKRGEVIVAIDVSDKGITAYFEREVAANAKGK